MRPSSPVLAYVGIGLLVAGFALAAFGWGKVAGLTAVPLQMPYLLSAGVPALGLIIIGATAVNIHVKFRDAEQRDARSEELADLLDQIRVLLGGAEREQSKQDDDPPSGANGVDMPSDGFEQAVNARPTMTTDSTDDTDEIPFVKRALAKLTRS